MFLNEKKLGVELFDEMAAAAHTNIFRGSGDLVRSKGYVESLINAL